MLLSDERLALKNKEYWSEVVALFYPTGAQEFGFFPSNFHMVHDVVV
jgi:hypothetical protein